MIRVLDLFSGLGGWSQAFLDRGHEVLRIDNDPKFRDVPNTKIYSILDWTPLYEEKWDVVLASPPCDGFSVATLGKMWSSPGVPKHPTARHGKMLLRMAIFRINQIDPTFWWLENPRGMMRKMEALQRYPRTTVTYCQYGESRMKPTDLWGKWPSTWTPRPPCKRGDSCHEAAPRGSPTGTQGIKGSAPRALIPYELSLEVCLAVEQALG